MVPRNCSVVLLDFPMPGLSDCIISPGRFRYWRRNSLKADSGSVRRAHLETSTLLGASRTTWYVMGRAFS
jgi:hypothetical protein